MAWFHHGWLKSRMMMVLLLAAVGLLTVPGLAEAVPLGRSAVSAASDNARTAVSPSLPPISAGPGQRVPFAVGSLLQNKLDQLAGASGVSNPPVSYLNWSGYAATPISQPFLEVQSTFVQPAVTCTVPNAWTVFWVGFDGFENSTVEQAGTAAQCGADISAPPTYYAWWEMWPTNSIQAMPLAVAPGNNIQATVTYAPSTAAFTMNVTNESTKQQYSKTTTCAVGLTCARQSVEWIVERPTVASAYTPLADWSTMTLANDEAANITTTKTTYVNKHKITTTSNVMYPISKFIHNTPIDMVGTASNLLASVGPLSAAGNSFVDTWQGAQ